MKKEFKSIQRKGLPGGPNEQFTYVTGVFMQDMYHVPKAQKGEEIIVSKDGQYAHPGKITRIPGNNITMKGVPYPVYAIPNVGMPTMMQSGQDYYFPDADYVDEIPMVQKGTGSFLDKVKDVLIPGYGVLKPAAEAVVESAKERIVDSITPYGLDVKHAMKEFIAGKPLPVNQLINEEGKVIDKQFVYTGEEGATAGDALAIYLGQPQKKNSFRKTNLRPTISKGENIDYYSLNNDDDLYDLAINIGLLDAEPGTIENIEDSEYGDLALKTFNISKGFDEKLNLPYISYADRNDYEIPTPLGKMSLDNVIGKPFGIYGRMYYDPETKKRIFPKMQEGGALPVYQTQGETYDINKIANAINKGQANRLTSDELAFYKKNYAQGNIASMQDENLYGFLPEATVYADPIKPGRQISEALANTLAGMAELSGFPAAVRIGQDPARYKEALKTFMSDLAKSSALAGSTMGPRPFDLETRQALQPQGGYANELFDIYATAGWLPALKGMRATKAVPNVTKPLGDSPDDLFNFAVREAFPDATDFENIIDVSKRISPTQASNILLNTNKFNFGTLAFSRKNASSPLMEKLRKQFKKGSKTIDEYVDDHLKDLKSDEGIKRLIQQESDYLNYIKFPKEKIKWQAKLNAFARINEIANIENLNKEILLGNRLMRPRDFTTRASFRFPSQDRWLNSDSFKSTVERLNPVSYRIGQKPIPGQVQINAGRGFSRPVAAHEIGGHGLQAGRNLPVDKRLLQLEPVENLSEYNKYVYDYFSKRRSSINKGVKVSSNEPSAYLHQLRQAMLDAGLLKNRYQKVTPTQIKNAQEFFKKKPSGIINKLTGQYGSDTQIFDFMKPSEFNFNLIARELNRLPATVPAVGASATLFQDQDGGENIELPKAQASRNLDEEPLSPMAYKVLKNFPIFQGLTNKQLYRRGSLLASAKAVADSQDSAKNLEQLLNMTAAMENTLGANKNAYGRTYTRGPMSIDDIAFDDLFDKRKGARDFTTQQKKNAAWFEGFGFPSDKESIDSLLTADNPLASMAVARMKYGRVPSALPDVDDKDAMFDYWLDNYNAEGVLKYKTKKQVKKDWNKWWETIYPAQEDLTEEDMQYGGEKAYETWERLTGKSWKQAKQEGYTDGSYKSNLDLQKKLLADEQSQQTTQQVSETTLQESNVYSFDNLSFNDAFAKARQMYGPNKIFRYKGKLKNTNIAGEPFKPSKEELGKWNMLDQSKDIEKQNKIIESPYTSQDVYEIPESKQDNLKQDITDTKMRLKNADSDLVAWDEIKGKQKDINRMQQADLVVNFQKDKADKDYIIIDKATGLMHLYHPNEEDPFVTYAVGVGQNFGDGQSVTKYKDLNNDGITNEDEVYRKNIDWNAGNKSTGAGKFYISNIYEDAYSGLPLFNMMNEQQYDEYKKTGKVENVSTSFHSGRIRNNNSNRVSNGCIRCQKGALENMYKLVNSGTEVFILPEEEQNKFFVQDGKLSFKSSNKNKYFKHPSSNRMFKKEDNKWFISNRDDKFEPLENRGNLYNTLDKEAVDLQYNIYEDKNGVIRKGQGINISRKRKQYSPIKIDINENAFSIDYDNDRLTYIVKPYAKALETNKKRIMDEFNITSDQYNDLIPVAMGILGNETKFGDQHNPAGNFTRAVTKFFDPTTSSPDYLSKYYIYQQKGNENSVGLTQLKWNSLQEGNVDQRLFKLGVRSNENTMYPAKSAVATMSYLAFLLNNRRKESMVPLDYLAKHYGGSSTNKDVYLNNVKNNSKYFRVMQYKQRGGEMRQVYADFINGNDQSKEAEKVFNKVNTMFYKEAKEKGMSAPNYIMSNIL